MHLHSARAKSLYWKHVIIIITILHSAGDLHHGQVFVAALQQHSVVMCNNGVTSRSLEKSRDLLLCVCMFRAASGFVFCMIGVVWDMHPGSHTPCNFDTSVRTLDFQSESSSLPLQCICL